MQSSVINKIEKARRYAEERDRICMQAFSATIKGDHSSHLISLKDDVWTCDCYYFSLQGLCSHTMALQRVLVDIIPQSSFSTNSA
jgi:hypothetical protein